jgi:hypothetical protein
LNNVKTLEAQTRDRRRRLRTQETDHSKAVHRIKQNSDIEKNSERSNPAANLDGTKAARSSLNSPKTLEAPGIDRGDWTPRRPGLSLKRPSQSQIQIPRNVQFRASRVRVRVSQIQKRRIVRGTKAATNPLKNLKTLEAQGIDGGDWTPQETYHSSAVHRIKKIQVLKKIQNCPILLLILMELRQQGVR